MATMRAAAEEFLSRGRIAVTGVSRTPGSHGGNTVYTRLRERGFDVVPVNPHTATAEGDACYPDLASVPGGVDAVVIATSPAHALATVEQAEALGVRYVWLHRGPGPASVDPEAVAYGRAHGMTVLDGGCPLMFGRASDPTHRVMCRLLTLTGAVPRRV
jgi:predicted CoA-binding protein